MRRSQRPARPAERQWRRRSRPPAGLPTAAPPPTASQFPDLKTERMLSLRPDGLPIATATSSATASGEARTSGVSRPRAKPALKAASETAQVGGPSASKLDLRTRPLGELPARVVAANIDTTAPSPMQETLSQRVQLGAPVNSEKAASALKAPQVAANPQAPVAPAQPVNPLVRAFSESIGALTARTGAAQRPICPPDRHHFVGRLGCSTRRAKVGDRSPERCCAAQRQICVGAQRREYHRP